MPWWGYTGYRIGAGSRPLTRCLVLGRVLPEASGDLGSIPNSALSSCAIMGKSLHLWASLSPPVKWKQSLSIPCWYYIGQLRHFMNCKVLKKSKQLLSGGTRTLEGRPIYVYRQSTRPLVWQGLGPAVGSPGTCLSTRRNSSLPGNADKEPEHADGQLVKKPTWWGSAR